MPDESLEIVTSNAAVLITSAEDPFGGIPKMGSVPRAVQCQLKSSKILSF